MESLKRNKHSCWRPNEKMKSSLLRPLLIIKQKLSRCLIQALGVFCFVLFCFFTLFFVLSSNFSLASLLWFLGFVVDQRRLVEWHWTELAYLWLYPRPLKSSLTLDRKKFSLYLPLVSANRFHRQVTPVFIHHWIFYVVLISNWGHLNSQISGFSVSGIFC